jgi:hypothetical integral membrane protein (TIGR02206 family)
LTGSAAHLATVGVIAILITALVTAARMRPGRWTRYAAWVLGAVVCVNEASWWVWLAMHHSWSAGYDLPLQLCDLAAITATLALWLQTQTLVELTYFWGIAGTANGLITPDVSEGFPSFPFLQYFIAHGSIVAAALFLVVGLRMAPRPGAVRRVIALTLCAVVVAALANLVTGGNYFYLQRTPGVRSALNYLGPWPLYIPAAGGVAVALFVLLDLPFWRGRRRRPARASS